MTIFWYHSEQSCFPYSIQVAQKLQYEVKEKIEGSRTVHIIRAVG